MRLYPEIAEYFKTFPGEVSESDLVAWKATHPDTKFFPEIQIRNSGMPMDMYILHKLLG